MIRHAFLAVAVGAFSCASTLSLAADAFTSNIPPFSIEQGPHVGFVREIVSEIDKRLGTDVRIVYGKSWPNSQEEAKSRPDTLGFVSVACPVYLNSRPFRTQAALRICAILEEVPSPLSG